MLVSQMIEECYRQLTQPSLWLSEQSQLKFIVHEHQDTTHHYDLRLRVGNHYLSWAVPKGPSLNPNDKRLAKETNLHSLFCEDREGRIPAGQYGAGGIIVWDNGLYRFDVPHGMSPERALIQALRAGEFTFELKGTKLKGVWTLKHWKDDKWLLIKSPDEFASTEDVTLQDRSVLTGKKLSFYTSNSLIWVELKKFYVAQHPQEKPVIILQDEHVLDANARAESWKIDPGMTARAARSILVEGTYLDWKPELYVERQREWLDLCTDFSDGIEPDSQHTAYIDLTQQPDPVEAADDLTRALSDRMRLTIRVGMARTKWIARLAVDLDNRGSAFMEPGAFVADLPVSCLAPVLPEHRERLHFLGYRQIGEVAKIPFDILVRQFGEQAYTIQHAAKGGYYQVVEPVYPPDSLADRWVFSEAVDSSETILASCKEWAGRIGKRLASKSQEGAKVKLTIEDEDGTLRALQRNFSKPIRCAKTALTALLLMVDGELTRPVLSLRLQIAELRKVKPHQGDLMLQGKDERRIHTALRQVRTVFGAESVQLASQIEEPRRVKVLREWKNAIGWR